MLERTIQTIQPHPHLEMTSGKLSQSFQMELSHVIAIRFLSISFCNRQAWLRLPSLLYTKWAKSKIYVTEHSDLLKISYLQLYDATIWLNDKQILPCFRSCVYNRSNKNSKQREEVSSILNEVIRTISRQFISFLRKKS